MAFNQEAELEYLAEINERVKRGWLEIRSGGAFGMGSAHCNNCDAYIDVICTDSPGNRLEQGDSKQTVNCPNCSASLGKFLSATRPVTLLITKEEHEKHKAILMSLLDLCEPSKPTKLTTNTNFEDDIPF